MFEKNIGTVIFSIIQELFVYEVAKDVHWIQTVVFCLSRDENDFCQ